MTDYAPPLSLEEQAKQILASITADDKEQWRLQLLAASAQGEGVDAVCDFGELVFGVVAAKHHRDWLAKMLAEPMPGVAGSRVATSSPPESAKTTWGTVIKTAWSIGKHPERAFGIGSAGEQAADDMAKAVAQTIEYNPRWKLAFPHVVPDKQRGWSSDGYHVRRTDLAEGEWERIRYGNKNPTLASGGVGSSRWNGIRLDGGLTLDDMHDRKSKTEQATNDNTVGFFKDTAEFRVTGIGFLHILQTRWNQKDIIAEVKARPDFVVFEQPAIVTVDGVETSYWPEYHPLAKLQAIRARDPLSFELVFQGNDRAIEGSTLKAAWLIPFPAAAFLRQWPHYIGIDFAVRLKEILKKGDDPDHFSMHIGADTGTRLAIEDVIEGIYFMSDAEDLFFSTAAIYQPKRVGLEVNGAAGKMYYQALLRRMRLGGQNYVIVPIHQSAAKGERIATVAPYCASGQIVVSDADTPGLKYFKAQWTLYPQGKDDSLDSLYNLWYVASHLLPTASVPELQEREKRRVNAITPAQMIDRAYGGRR